MTMSSTVRGLVIIEDKSRLATKPKLDIVGVGGFEIFIFVIKQERERAEIHF